LPFATRTGRPGVGGVRSCFLLSARRGELASFLHDALPILFKVELPLAIPVIMAGIRTAAVINVGNATLAAFIGAGGLGDFIFLGITRGIDGLILLGAIPATLLAIILETFFSSIERWTTPEGLR